MTGNGRARAPIGPARAGTAPHLAPSLHALETMNAPLTPVRALPALALSCLALASAAQAGGGLDGLTDRVLFAPGGGQIADDAFVTDMSPDGRYIVFQTTGALDVEDTNGLIDVYLLDRQSGAVTPVSTSLAGVFGNGHSRGGKVSDDGRYVVFETEADDIIGFDFNGATDVVRKDLSTGVCFRVSTPLGTILAANAKSSQPDISATGRYVAFRSEASDLAPGTVPGVGHIFWRDMDASVVERITTGVFSEPTNHSWAPSISADGQRVAYASTSSVLVLLDNNNAMDVFVEDVFGPRKLVSRGPGGVLGNGNSMQPRLSADGQTVLFDSVADNLVLDDTNIFQDVFAAHVASGIVALVSELPGGGTGSSASFAGGLSANGQFAVFASSVDDLTSDVVTHTSVYVRDLEEHTTWLASRPSGTTKLPNDSTFACAIDSTGSLVAFSSQASNLDQGDTNGVSDVFVRELFADPTVYCVTGTTSAGCQPQVAFSGKPSAGANAGFVVSASAVPNNQIGVFLFSLDGAANLPILGGTLCIGPIAGRSPGLFSAGNPFASDCSGNFTLDLNAYAAGHLGGAPNPGLSQVGQQVNGQFWGRDPASPAGFYFSEAIEYVVGL